MVSRTCFSPTRSRGSPFRACPTKDRPDLSVRPPLLRFGFREEAVASGVCRALEVGQDAPESLLVVPLSGSPGFLPPWGFPLARTRFASLSGHESPFLYFRKAPGLGSQPCTPKCQRTGKLACLFRGCRPLRGFRPRLLRGHKSRRKSFGPDRQPLSPCPIVSIELRNFRVKHFFFDR